MKTLNEKILEEEKFKRDITLNINEFNRLTFFEDRESLARMLQHIVITKKGTYPNNPDFGVGIEDYIFEQANTKTQNTICNSINSQIAKWINVDDKIHISTEVKFVKVPNVTHFVNLVIYFSVSRNNVSADKEDNFILTLYVTGETTNRNVLSKLEL